MIKLCKIYAGVMLYGGPRASSLLNLSQALSFHHEYSSLACTVEIVDDVYAAIDHINLYGRHVTVYFLIGNTLKYILLSFIFFAFHFNRHLW